MTRKSPIRHQVKSHTRKNKSVSAYVRGSGNRIKKRNRHRVCVSVYVQEKRNTYNSNSMNPFSSPDSVRKFITPIVNTYMNKLGICQKVSIAPRKSGPAAQAVFDGYGRTTKIYVNYKKFSVFWAKSQELAKQYLEYAIAHELSHVKQHEELGYVGFKRAVASAIHEVESDAQNRTFRVMGTTEKEVIKRLNELGSAVGVGEFVTESTFKGVTNIKRFEDHIPFWKSQEGKN